MPTTNTSSNIKKHPSSQDQSEKRDGTYLKVKSQCDEMSRLLGGSGNSSPMSKGIVLTNVLTSTSVKCLRIIHVAQGNGSVACHAKIESEPLCRRRWSRLSLEMLALDPE
jgi:hypothetical protein